jgi:T5orf172 domain
MPRLWLSGPRIFGMRPGISFRFDELLRRPPPRRQLQGSFIYIIRGDHGLIKIGVSTNPSARLAQLRTASAVHLEIAYVGALRCNGYAVEGEAHRTLADYRQNGEWFNCPVDMAVAAIGAAAYRLGEPIASGDPKLADEVVRIAAETAAEPSHNIITSAVLFVVKGVLGIVFAAVAWAGFYVAYLIVTVAGTNSSMP